MARVVGGRRMRRRRTVRKRRLEDVEAVRRASCFSLLRNCLSFDGLVVVGWLLLDGGGG